MAYEKHVGIYQTKEELTADLNKLISPWVAYVGPNENGGFDVYYSNEITLGSNSLNIADELNRRITKLEERIVTLTEEEYEALIEMEEGTEMEITHVDGTKEFVSYNPEVFYYTYDPTDLPEEE